MLKKWWPGHSFAVAVLFAAASLLQAQAAPVSSGVREIEAMLEQRIDEEKQGVALVLGMIDGNKTRVVSHGMADMARARPAGPDTIFEIGSITKVFTSVLLADMAARGEVKLDDPVAKYLPKEVRVPTRNGREITLQDLATHRSGLPRMPANWQPRDHANPYVDYTVEQLYAFLSTHTLARDIGSEAEYSNIGVGLLGHALALRARMSYEQLLRVRLLRPLGMRHTAVTLTPPMRARAATGYSAPGAPVPMWDIPALAGAGAVRSSLNDMLKFLAAAMDSSKGPLAPAIRSALSAPLLPGWSTSTRYGSAIVHKDGGTGGFHSFIGFDAAQKTGVVVLSNSALQVVDIGHKALNREFNLVQLVPPKAFERELEQQGYQHAEGMYDQFKQRDSGFHLREQILNEWGYALLNKGRMRDGIALLKLGVRLRPKSANVYDSLAEAYEKDGNPALALENYQRVLQLDPANANAAARIKALEQGQAAPKL